MDYKDYMDYEDYKDCFIVLVYISVYTDCKISICLSVCTDSAWAGVRGGSILI
jgi:hypothetical protein